MIYTKQNFGTLKNKTIIEIGEGSVGVSSGGNIATFRSIEKTNVGRDLGRGTLEEIDPEILMVFNNEEGLDVVIRALNLVKQEFEKTKHEAKKTK